MTTDRSTATRFVVCVEPGNYAASLERWKIYRTVADAEAARSHQVRVIDESGEDYLYPSEWFRSLHLPRSIARLYARSRRATQ